MLYNLVFALSFIFVVLANAVVKASDSDVYHGIPYLRLNGKDITDEKLLNVVKNYFPPNKYGDLKLPEAPGSQTIYLVDLWKTECWEAEYPVCVFATVVATYRFVTLVPSEPISWWTAAMINDEEARQRARDEAIESALRKTMTVLKEAKDMSIGNSNIEVPAIEIISNGNHLTSLEADPVFRLKAIAMFRDTPIQYSKAEIFRTRIKYSRDGEAGDAFEARTTIVLDRGVDNNGLVGDAECSVSYVFPFAVDMFFDALDRSSAPFDFDEWVARIRMEEIVLKSWGEAKESLIKAIERKK